MRKIILGLGIVSLLVSCTSNKEFAMLKEKVDKLEAENKQLTEALIRLDERTSSIVQALTAGASQGQQQQQANAQTVYEQTDVPPSFPGGDKAMFEFFGKNFKWPEGAEFKGKIEAKFVVEPTGQISNFSFTKAGPEAIGKEIVRVFTLMPRWQPGTIKGQPVRAWYVLPITI